MIGRIIKVELNRNRTILLVLNNLILKFYKLRGDSSKGDIGNQLSARESGVRSKLLIIILKKKSRTWSGQ